jgi:para-aminobenzoate synthetase
MRDSHSNNTDDRMKAISEIRRLQSSRPGPIVVAIDGGSGAGKSTFASWVADKANAVLIPIDDFFAADVPDNQWDDLKIADRLNYVFDWQRVRDCAIKPLLAGEPARWYAFDFESDLRPNGTYGMKADPKEREPADVILLEGAYSACPFLSDLVDLAILVDVPLDERRARLAAREDKEFLNRWHKMWDAVEEYYFTQVRPRASFDLVVGHG